MLDHEKLDVYQLSNSSMLLQEGSAMECGAVLDACKVLNVIETDLYEKGKDMLTRIVSMLIKMCKL